MSAERGALGMLEVHGLIAAIGAADAMAKAAAVTLDGPHLAGSGLVTVMARGEIAAVSEAIEAGAAVAARLGRVIARGVIGRPVTDLAGVFSVEKPRPTGHGPPAIG